MVEHRVAAGEHRHAQVVLDRQRADREYQRDARDVAHVEALDADVRQQEEQRAARGACERVQLLAEDERHDVDADVAQHAAEHGRYHPEEDRAPPRAVAVDDRLLHADHHEDRYRDRVEDEPRYLAADEAPSEQPDRHDRDARRREVERVGQPERLHLHEHVAQRAAADGGDYADDARAEPVEALCAGQAHARHRPRERSYEFERPYEDVYSVCHVRHCGFLLRPLVAVYYSIKLDDGSCKPRGNMR